MVTGVEDVLEAVFPMIGAPRNAIPALLQRSSGAGARPRAGESDRSLVLEALGPSPIEVDEVIRLTGLPARAVHVILLELDLAGRVERQPGQRIALGRTSRLTAEFLPFVLS